MRAFVGPAPFHVRHPVPLHTSSFARSAAELSFSCKPLANYSSPLSTRRRRCPVTGPRSVSACTSSTSGLTLPSRLRELATALSAAPSVKARYLALVALGRDLQNPTAAAAANAPEHRVHGCTAVVHLRVAVLPTAGGPGAPAEVRLTGNADGLVARGMVALVVRGLDGADAGDVLAVRADELARACGLEVGFAPSRVGGLAKVVEAVQARTREGMAALERAGARPCEQGVKKTIKEQDGDMVRWSGVQAEDVAVLLSGGVDSSVALRLVMDAGYRPHAFYLKIWLEDELAHLGECPWEEDMAYATAVCEQAGVALESIPLQHEYWDRVVAYTIAEARAGRTPNPDVMCNSRVKFGAFYDRAGLHFPQVITGHYARVEVDPASRLAQLRTSPDAVKDQTYFLAHLTQSQLSRARFPVGKFKKEQVRELAHEYHLPNRTRKDSQGICFLGKLKFDKFLEHHLGTVRGPLVEYETGVTVGMHRGFWFYTMGQRKGLGLSGGPWHVMSKNPQENVVYVSRTYNDLDKARDRFDIESASWISGSWPAGLEREGSVIGLSVKVRHGPSIVQCRVTRTGESKGRVVLSMRDKGLAPGQFAAFYDGGICLGSAIIAGDVALSNAHIANDSETRLHLQTHYYA